MRVRSVAMVTVAFSLLFSVLGAVLILLLFQALSGRRRRF
jgi:uncharacterized membrane protein YeaQ/YmgE (transglycosylase-associated protein family)